MASIILQLSNLFHFGAPPSFEEPKKAQPSLGY